MMLLDDLDKMQRLVRAVREPVLRGHGLNAARYAALRALADHPDATGGELAQVNGVRHQTLRQTLQGLERAGLVELAPPVGPGLARRGQLTRRGTVLVERCRGALVEIEHRALARFSAEQVDLFQQFLEECTRQLRRMRRPPRGRPHVG
jgi:DNA-binding MarR family transcriptional regulator